MIDEVPPGRALPAAEPGIRHREISWRAAMLRRSLPVMVPPRWVDPLVLVLLVGYLLGGVAAAPVSLEEAVQTSLTADAGALVTRPQALLPGGAVSATEESVRLAYGSLTRYAAAVGWYVAGGRAAQVPVDVTATGAAEVRIPERRLVIASRAGPVVLSGIGLLVMFLLARRLLGRPAALLAVLVLGLHPAFVLLARQAADAGLTLTLGLASVLVAAGICTVVARGAEPRLGAWILLLLLVGLTLASGTAAVPYVAGAVAFCLAGLLGRQLHRRREVLEGRPAEEVPDVAGTAGWMAVTALGAVLVWVAVSPALWGWLPERLATRAAERPALAAQGLLPDPAPGAPTGLRAVAGAVSDPFLTPQRQVQVVEPSTYEQTWWAGAALGERGADAVGPLARLLPPALTGVLSTLLGLALTVAAAVGMVGLWRTARLQAGAVTGWLLVAAGWLVLSPSGQADHLLPLLAVACVLVGAAAMYGLSFVARLSRDSKEAVDARMSPHSLDFLGTRDPGAHRARP